LGIDVKVRAGTILYMLGAFAVSVRRHPELLALRSRSCPIYPGHTNRLQHAFEDPAEGSDEERQAVFRGGQNVLINR
jgi:hypothetical protein